MKSLVDLERQTYEEMWALPLYAEHSPGEQSVTLFQEMALTARFGDVVLDAGCGAGKGALALHAAGFSVRMMDITDVGLLSEAKHLPFLKACLWDDNRAELGYLPGGRVDWVYCCDVLEHIDPAFTMLTVQRLLDLTRHGVFLTISLQADNLGVWIGKPLHQTVEGFVWWRDHLATLGSLVEARDLIETGVYLVRPR